MISSFRSAPTFGIWICLHCTRTLSPVVWQANSIEAPCTFRKIDTVAVDLNKVHLILFMLQECQSGHTPTLHFRGSRPDGRRSKCTELRERLRSTTKFEHENAALLCCYSNWSVDRISCEPRWSPTQHFIVKILKFHCPVTPAGINVVILCDRHGVQRVKRRRGARKHVLSPIWKKSI